MRLWRLQMRPLEAIVFIVSSAECRPAAAATRFENANPPNIARPESTLGQYQALHSTVYGASAGENQRDETAIFYLLVVSWPTLP